MGPWVASVPTASHLREGQRRDAWGRGSGHQGALLATLEGKVVETRTGGGDWGLTTPAGNEPRKDRGWGGEEGPGCCHTSWSLLLPRPQPGCGPGPKEGHL